MKPIKLIQIIFILFFCFNIQHISAKTIHIYKKDNSNHNKKQYIQKTNIKYIVFNYKNGEVLEEKNSQEIWPIASLTKLMTAYIFINRIPNINSCNVKINEEDIDLIKNTKTKLSNTKPYTCLNLLEVMLIASDNYAASALSRSIPGLSKKDFVKQMNIQAKKWNLNNTNFVDPSGLSPLNISSVQDYKILATNVVQNDIISNISSHKFIYAENKFNKQIIYKNSNKLVRDYNFQVNLSKTGHINESGYNLVHLANCKKPIGVIEFGAKNSNQRAFFVKNKLANYGCD